MRRRRNSSEGTISSSLECLPLAGFHRASLISFRVLASANIYQPHYFACTKPRRAKGLPRYTSDRLGSPAPLFTSRGINARVFRLCGHRSTVPLMYPSDRSPNPLRCFHDDVQSLVTRPIIISAQIGVRISRNGEHDGPDMGGRVDLATNPAPCCSHVTAHD
jgi:hypothetical protein